MKQIGGNFPTPVAGRRGGEEIPAENKIEGRKTICAKIFNFPVETQTTTLPAWAHHP